MPFLFFRWGDENSERESHFPEVTQPVSNRGRAPIPPANTTLWNMHSLVLMAGEDAADGRDFQSVER